MAVGVAVPLFQYGVAQRVSARSGAGFEAVPLSRTDVRAATLRPQATQQELWPRLLSYPFSNSITEQAANIRTHSECLHESSRSYRESLRR